MKQHWLEAEKLRETLGAATLLAFALGLDPMAAAAQTLGMVVDDFTSSVTVFNADTDTVIGSVAIGPGLVEGDCTINSDGTLGFVTNFNNELWVIDLVTPRASPGGSTRSRSPTPARTPP